MRILVVLPAALLLISGFYCSEENSTEPEKNESKLSKGDYHAPYAETVPSIDGNANEACWDNAEWAPIDVVWLGSTPSEKDFCGQFKVVWNEDKLFVHVELVDDAIVDTHRDPLDNYWNDDCLEVFIDEDRSKGDHKYNYNAFAYHVSYERHAVDIGPSQKAQLFDEHVTARWKQNDDRISWELAFDVYDDSYRDNGENTPVTLEQDKVMGFMIAYCDADGSDGRQSFVGSIPIEGQDKNMGWKDASVFGELTLVE